MEEVFSTQKGMEDGYRDVCSAMGGLRWLVYHFHIVNNNIIVVILLL